MLMHGTSAVAASSRRPPTATENALLEAVVILRPVRRSGAPAPAATREAARTVLENVQKQTGLAPEAVNVFDQLHSFSVRAPARFIQALSSAKGVATVTANELPESALISPVKRRIIKLPD